MSKEVRDALDDVHAAIEELDSAFKRLGRAKITEISIPPSHRAEIIRVEDVMDVDVTVTVDHELEDPPSEA